MESAFLWWNKAADDLDETTTPEITDPEEANLIWIDLAPVFRTFLDPKTQNYWVLVKDLLKKLTKMDDIPNPESDFPGFVNVLYNNQNLIKPKTFEDCKNLINTFYDDYKPTFFINQFLYAVSDPILAIKTYDLLLKEKYPQFIDYLKQPGTIERLYDMLMSFILPLSPKNDQEFFNFALILADFLTELVTSNIREIVLLDDIHFNLFLRLLSLINQSSSISAEVSVNYARIAIKVCNASLKNISATKALTRITTLITSAPPGKPAHNYIARYALSLAGKYITYSDLITNLTKQGLKNVSDIDFLLQIAKQGGVEVAKRVIRVFSSIMMSTKLYSRASAALIVETLKAFSDESSLRDWVLRFITKLIIFLKNSFALGKYTNRAHLLCEIITSETFMSIGWLYKGVNSNANAAYLIDEKPEEFKSYFYIGQNYPISSYFAREYKKIGIFIRTAKQLKSFPFKPGTSQFAKIGGVEDDDKENDNKISDAIKKLGLSSRIINFIKYDEEINKIDQQQNIFLLEDFIDHENEKFGISKNSFNSVPKFNVKNFMPKGRMELTAIVYIFQDLENQICQYQMEALKEHVSIAKEIISAIHIHPHIIGNIKLLARSLNTGSSSDPKYKKLKMNKERIKKMLGRKAYQYRVSNFSLNTGDELLKVFYTFDSLIQYCPPSEFDQHVVNYLNFSDYMPMIKAITDIVSAGIVDATIQTLWELNQEIVEKLQLGGDATYVIVYTSIVRYIFDINYIENLELNQYNEENAIFTKICNNLAERPLRMLDIQHIVETMVTTDVSISSFFKTRMHTLNIIEFFTNPIDIMANIHLSISSLYSIIPDNVMTEDEKVKLIMGLIISFPPNNTISIIRFIDKWSQITPSKNILISYMKFRKAVNMLYPLDKSPSNQLSI